MSDLKTVMVRDVCVPHFFYGTAWKEDHTEHLVQKALEAGFLGIDTANQRKHYFEAAVGQAVKQAIDQHLIKRSALFLQTKFTYAQGQDHRLPYDPNADYTTQVRQSFQKSLEHLHTDYLDSYVLHGPSVGMGLAKADLEVWRAMEDLHLSGQVKLLGVSNVRLDQLEKLFHFAKIKPAFVQNRCYAQTRWDLNIREFCHDHEITYQGFSLLTANGRELNRPEVFKIAERLQGTVAQLVFCFAIHVGMIPLTGTTDFQHMSEDLQAHKLTLTKSEVEFLENIAFL